MKRIFSLLVVAAACCAAQNAETEWPHYGNDAGGSRYSPLKDVNRETVGRLKVAWTYRTGALNHPGVLNRKAAFEATPILVEGALYLNTPFNQIVALDPATGAERWRFDPEVDRNVDRSEVAARGVSAWRDPKAKSGAPCALSIYEGTLDARLIAIDGRTGAPCQAFGKAGQVDLTPGIDLKDPGDYQVTSPPAVVNGVVVIGSAIGDNRRFDVERGTVRGYDARSGKLLWSWDPLPRTEKTGAANAWGVISSDPARDLVFIPTGSASPDFFGGVRPGDNRYANSVVALKASTGKLIWSFQAIHHDLWDYDVAAQPTLVNVRIGGKVVPAVAVTTKSGSYFLLQRETGAPLIPVEEKPVPASDVDGETASATQPFPQSDPLVPRELSANAAWGISEEDRNACRELLSRYRGGSVFTPPSLQGTIVAPGNVGGVAWGGVSVDPERGLLLVNTNRLPTVVKLIPRGELDAARAAMKTNRFTGEFGRQSGTPYAMYREFPRSPHGIPCVAPPWGTIAAYDLATGKRKWETPLGSLVIPAGALGNKEAVSIAGDINLGGSLTTAGGVIFIAATRSSQKLRAFDSETGKLLWEGDLPAAAQATPMTFRSEKDGKQYVVISAGGHGKLESKMGDYVVAFRLE